MKTVAALALALALAAPAAAATKPKPKPWSWTTAKVAARLVAANPSLGTDEPGEILQATCVGTGKSVAKRYVAFRCSVKWATQGVGLSGAYPYVVVVKMKPTGTGKMCVARDTFAAIDPDCLAV